MTFAAAQPALSTFVSVGNIVAGLANLTANLIDNGSQITPLSTPEEYGEAMRYLKQSRYARRIIERLEDELSKQDIEIVIFLEFFEDDYYDETGETNPFGRQHAISWDPFSTIKNEGGGVISPALMLFHELAHAYDVIVKGMSRRGFKEDSKKRKKWKNNREKSATKKGDKVAKQLGENMRKHYLSSSLGPQVSKPTSTKSGKPSLRRRKNLYDNNVKNGIWGK